MAVLWIWSGATTPTGVVVTAKTGGSSARLVASTSSSLSSPIYSSNANVDADGYVRMTLTGLAVGTAYHYGVEVDGTLDPIRGRVRTLPAGGRPASFRVGFASCAWQTSGYNLPVYERIVEKDPTLFVHLGDFHYAGGQVTDAASTRGVYDACLTQSYRRKMHEAMAVPYMWDDHEFASDDGDRTSPQMSQVRDVIKQISPIGTLPGVALGDPALYRAWTIGRIPFILTDLRSHRDPSAAVDDPPKTAMGASQKTWFKDQLLAAKTAGAPLIFWCSTSVFSLPGSAYGGAGADTWGQYATERAELVDWMHTNAIPPVVVLSGDAHQLSWHYGQPLGASRRTLPEHVSAPLAAPPATRVGDWAFGPHVSTSQYSTLDVRDDGTTVSYTVTGFAVDGAGVERVVYSVTDNARDWQNRPAFKVWNGSTWVPRATKTWNGAAWVHRPLSIQ